MGKSSEEKLLSSKFNSVIAQNINIPTSVVRQKYFSWKVTLQSLLMLFVEEEKKYFVLTMNGFLVWADTCSVVPISIMHQNHLESLLIPIPEVGDSNWSGPKVRICIFTWSVQVMVMLLARGPQPGPSFRASRMSTAQRREVFSSSSGLRCTDVTIGGPPYLLVPYSAQRETWIRSQNLT